jgi:hypothetical protein
LAIEWDVIIVEMSLLAGIIYGAVYFEIWHYERTQNNQEKQAKKKIVMFILNDRLGVELGVKLHLCECR